MADPPRIIPDGYQSILERDEREVDICFERYFPKKRKLT